MATYAIGDVQGCFDELQALLQHIQFDAKQDSLWFVGDLVNRGPKSLEVLRFIHALGEAHITVLGNHDVHLLSVAYQLRASQPGDTLDAILQAPDRDHLLDWLRHRPLLHVSDSLPFAMSHAGIAPCWTLAQAKMLAAEVEAILRSDEYDYLLMHLYGNEPDIWQDDLVGIARWRLIINYFTRMRFCDADGRLALQYKGEIAHQPADFMPWFMLPNRLPLNKNIVFGHWAALNGETNTDHIFAIDTGCVWGNCLTALRLDDLKRFSVGCKRW